MPKKTKTRKGFGTRNAVGKYSDNSSENQGS